MRDLFEAAAERLDQDAPLAERMRPCRLGEVVGQAHLLGPGRMLTRMIGRGRLPSLILYGPPGSGKTTLAHLIARETRTHFEKLSAVMSGVAELREVLKRAAKRRAEHREHTVLFVDEIHRWSKSQQDALLEAVEKGTVTLIGATTENPSYELNTPLLSRARVLLLERLSDDDLKALVDRALSDKERGLGAEGLTIEDGAKSLLVDAADGDARQLLSILEIAARYAANAQMTRTGLPRTETTPTEAALAGYGRTDVVGTDVGATHSTHLDSTHLDSTHLDSALTQSTCIERSDVEEAVQHRSLAYDKSGDAHYSVISAFIKSLRGSDADAAAYYLVRMLESGEDPRFILRRLVIFASEDVGNADPRALTVAVDALRAFEFIGLPEGVLPLTQAVTYLAVAPKSNSALTTYAKARKAVLEHGPLPVPSKLINANNALDRSMGRGRNYKYPHDLGGFVPHEVYLPDALAGQRYYTPSAQGYERVMSRSVARRTEERTEKSSAEDPAFASEMSSAGIRHGTSAPEMSSAGKPASASEMSSVRHPTSAPEVSSDGSSDARRRG